MKPKSIEEFMSEKHHRYPFIVKETYLDSFGHMNNAVYLTLFEEARWDLITKHGYGLKKIMETGYGPVILEIDLKFLKELRLREEIVIESINHSYDKKISKMTQKMIRGDDICCTAELTIGFFNLKERKLVMPTPEWLGCLDLFPH